MKKIALITGGSGFVGKRLIVLGLAQGWEVRAIGRSPSALRTLARLGAEPIEGDLTDAPSLRRAATGCTAVFHAAALFKLWGKSKDFTDVNVAGTQMLVDAASTVGVRRFVQIGAAAVVMGDPEPLLRVNEDLPVQMRSWAPYSSSKSRADLLVRAANQPRGMQTCVVRPPLIWGADMPMLDQIAQSIHTRQFRWPGDGSQVMSTCHVDNVCHATLLAAERGQGGAAYFITDGEDRTFRQVITDLLATKDVTPPHTRVPFRVAWFMARCMESAWRLFHLKGEPPITRQMLRLIGQPFTLDMSKAQRELCYQPLVHWADGLSAMPA